MQTMSIADAAKYYGISKEAIHNRIRRGSLESVMDDNEKKVIIDEKTPKTKKATKTTKTNVATQINNKYYEYLETQNEKLQIKVEKLEDETRDLRNQKEQMLIEERKKIEQIYKDKDEQLKNILNAISSKFIPQAPNESVEAEIEDAVEDAHVEFSKENTILTSLNKYLKKRDFSKKKRKKIKEKFEKNYKKDDRIIRLNKKYYIDLDRFDYSDYLL